MFLDDKIENSYKYFYRRNMNNLSNNITPNTSTITNVNSSGNINSSVISNINKFKIIYRMNKFNKFYYKK